MKVKRRNFWLLVAAVTTGPGFACSCYIDKIHCRSTLEEYRDYWKTFLPVSHPQNDHRLLLRLCRSRNARSRRLGVHAFGKIINMPDWKAIDIAQASDPSVLAALILNGVNLSKYLPCRVLLDDDGKLEQKLNDVLTHLSSRTNDAYLKFHSENALQKPALVHTTQELELLWAGKDETADPNLLSERPDDKRLLLYVNALHAHSSVPDQCKEFVKQRGLDVLIRLWRYAEQAKVKVQLQTAVLKILSNLALHPDLKSFIVQTGWMQIFQNYLVDPSLEYNTLVKKILHNLSSVFDNEAKFEEGVYPVYGDEYSKERPVVDIVFVHGLRGGLFWTWRQRDIVQFPEPIQPLIASRPRTSCWPKDWLPFDVNKPIRIVGVDYASFLTSWNRIYSDATTKNSFEVRSVELLNKLRKAGIGNRPVIWVTHSMGGLVVKQMLQCLESGLFLSEDELSYCRPMLDNTAGCIFYSVPHYGSPVASNSVDSYYSYFLLPSVEVGDLKENSTYLLNLHTDFCRLVKRRRIEVLNLAETLKTKVARRFELELVPERSTLGGGIVGRCYFLKDSHFNTCKPVDRRSPSYCILVDFINEILEALEIYSF